MWSRIYKLIFLCMMLCSVAMGQVRQERDFKKSFSIERSGKVEIRSKYGEVIVRAWDKDSVKFDVVVKAEGKSTDAVQKSMRRVDIQFRKVGKIITASTDVQSVGGLLGNLTSQLEDVVGNHQLLINYQVWLPKDILLSVENKYGNIYLTDLTNKVEITLAHGDLKTGDIHDHLTLDHNYGKSSFRSIGTGTITLRGAEMQVDEAGDLNVESGSSEIRIDKVKRTRFNSRNDKISIREAREVVCEGSFTDLTLELLQENALLHFSYGDIYLARIDKEFSNIDITGKSTDINLILDQASFIKTFIKGPEERMILPNSMLTMKKQRFESEGLISLSGEVGPPNSRHSDLRVSAEGGELVISIKETPLFSERD